MVPRLVRGRRSLSRCHFAPLPAFLVSSPLTLLLFRTPTSHYPVCRLVSLVASHIFPPTASTLHRSPTSRSLHNTHASHAALHTKQDTHTNTHFASVTIL